MNAAPATHSTNDIRPAKTIVEIPGSASVLIWAAIAAAVFMAAFAAHLRYRRRSADVSVRRPPHVIAREQLNRALQLTGDPRLFFIAVSDIMRRYFEGCLRLSATEQTTEEFLKSLETSPWMKPAQKTTLNGFLLVCDLAKFARYESHQDEMLALHQAAMKLVEETELHSFRSADTNPISVPTQNHPA